MRVMQINSFFSTGGPPRIVNGIHTALKEKGEESRIAAARGIVQYPEDSYRIGTAWSVYRNALEARFLDNEGLSAVNETAKLIRKIENDQPDIIHLHNLHGYYINIELLFDFLKQAGIPVVWTFHDCWPMTGHCPHFDFIGCEKWKSGCSGCPQKKEYPASFCIDGSYRNYLRKRQAFQGVRNLVIAAPSKWLASFIPQSFLREYPVKVIQNGIDLTVFRPSKSEIRKKYGLENKKIILGVAQNWSRMKGLDDFIRLAEILPEQYKVTLIGLNRSQLQALPEKILGFGTTENIRELTEWYTAADVFVNPTYQDTFPTVNLEALACGTPVITYGNGGSGEMLTEECGRILPGGNPEEISAAVCKMPEKQQYTEACLAQARLYEKNISISLYTELYKALLKKS